MPEPFAHLGPIPVVRALIANAGGRILLLRRARTRHAEGRWCLPGGKIDYGVSLVEALSREIFEETKLEVLSASFLFPQDGLPTPGKDLHCVNLYYSCDVKGELRLNGESSAHAWVTLDTIGDYDIAFGNDVAMREYWERTARKGK